MFILSASKVSLSGLAHSSKATHSSNSSESSLPPPPHERQPKTFRVNEVVGRDSFLLRGVRCSLHSNQVDFFVSENTGLEDLLLLLFSSSWLPKAYSSYKNMSFLEPWLTPTEPASQVRNAKQAPPAHAEQNRHVSSNAAAGVSFNQRALLIKAFFGLIRISKQVTSVAVAK